MDELEALTMETLRRHEKLLAEIMLMKKQGLERAEDKARYAQLCSELQTLTESEPFRASLSPRRL